MSAKDIHCRRCGVKWLTDSSTQLSDSPSDLGVDSSRGKHAPGEPHSQRPKPTAWKQWYKQWYTRTDLGSEHVVTYGGGGGLPGLLANAAATRVADREAERAARYGWVAASEEVITKIPLWWWVFFIGGFPLFSLILGALHLMGANRRTLVTYQRTGHVASSDADPSIAGQGLREEQSVSGAPSGDAKTDPIERLRIWQSMRDEGLITQAEFDAKRAELLNDL